MVFLLSSCLCVLYFLVSASAQTYSFVWERRCIVCSIRILGLKFSTHFLFCFLTDTHLLACFFFCSCWNCFHFDFRRDIPVSCLCVCLCSQRDFLCRTIIFTALCVVVAHVITVCVFCLWIFNRFFFLFCY